MVFNLPVTAIKGGYFMRVFENFQKGVNLGGWLSQYEKYDTNHFDTFITEKDIEYIASLGFDHVRVPVDYIVLEDEDGNVKESGFQYLRTCQNWCARHGLNMLIDLHECYGYSFDPLKDMDREKFFYDDALQARFLKLWARIAQEFGKYPEQIAFEPLNEIVLESVADAWNKVASKFIKTVREYAPDTYLVIGGVCYSNVLSIPLIDVENDGKIVYNFHCYEPMIFTHQRAYWIQNMDPEIHVSYPGSLEYFREKSRPFSSDFAGAIFNEAITESGPKFFEDIFKPAIDAASAHNIPLYCGEYGVIELADNESKIAWLRDIHSVFNKYGIGRALWNYKEKDFGFVDEKFAEVQDEFISVL